MNKTDECLTLVNLDGLKKTTYLKIVLNLLSSMYLMDFPGGSDNKESTCNAGDLGSTLGLGRKWQRIPVSLPGEFHG